MAQNPESKKQDYVAIRVFRETKYSFVNAQTKAAIAHRELRNKAIDLTQDSFIKILLKVYNDQLEKSEEYVRNLEKEIISEAME